MLERVALHDNATLHVAAMGFWVLLLAKDDAVTGCQPMPSDIREVTVPAKYDTLAPFVFSRTVPQLFKPGGRVAGVQRAASATSSSARGRVTAKVGQRLTWRFTGVEPHSVTVANGPRGFSSNYLGNVRGSYSFTPTVPGTYRLTCLIHPTTMAQTLVGQTRLEEVEPEVVERPLGLDVQPRQLAGEQQDAHRDQDQRPRPR